MYKYTDTHCHFLKIKERGIELEQVFQKLVAEKCPFVLDSGTEFNDFSQRYSVLRDLEEKAGNKSFLHFSAGIWPSSEAVENRFFQVSELEKCIKKSLAVEKHSVCALGECGIDRHWNTAGKDFFMAEEELFRLQIELAKKFNLPLIVHSRSSFEETYRCLKDSGITKGVIHCFSYGPEEAAKFCDLGFSISLSGGVTYAKNNEKNQLIKSIPREKLLLETDSPYLTPVPHRGKVNTPLLIEHLYQYVAERLSCSVESLCALVLSNSLSLFG